jgi:hypothetical protein
MCERRSLHSGNGCISNFNSESMQQGTLNDGAVTARVAEFQVWARTGGIEGTTQISNELTSQRSTQKRKVLG